jgi:hypothetical protein
MSEGEEVKRVRLVGWREGFSRLKFTELLEEAGYEKSKADLVAACFVFGSAVTVATNDPEALKSSARAAGVIVEGDPD